MVGNVGRLKWFAAGRYFLGGRKEHEEPGGEHQGPAEPSVGWTLPRSQLDPIATAWDSREAPSAAAGKRGASGGGHGEETPKEAAGRYF